MKKHEQILKSYKRNHSGDNFEDWEKSKISRDKGKAKKLEKRAENMVSTITEAGGDELIDEYDEILQAAKKVSGSSGTHKARLKELQKNEDFK